MEPYTASLLVLNLASVTANIFNSRHLQRRNEALQIGNLERTHEFQTEQAALGRDFQRRLAREAHAAQRQIAAESGQRALEQMQRQRTLDAWPLVIPPEVVQQYASDAIPPLTVLISPLQLQYDRHLPPAQKNTGEAEFTEGVRRVIGRWYPLHSTERPVQFLGGAWKSKAAR